MKPRAALLAACFTLAFALPAFATEDGREPDEPDSDPASGGALTGGERPVAAAEVTPLQLFVGPYGASLEIVPIPHYGLVLSGSYAFEQGDDDPFVQLDDHGCALDVGYRAQLGPMLLGVSAGAQYVHGDASSGDLFPDVSARSVLRPRAGFTLGYAF